MVVCVGVALVAAVMLTIAATLAQRRRSTKSAIRSPSGTRTMAGGRTSQRVREVLSRVASGVDARPADRRGAAGAELRPAS